MSLRNAIAKQLDQDDSFIEAAIRMGYREVKIKKAGGGWRTLSIPCQTLKTVQSCLARRLETIVRPHPAAHGFVHGRSVVTAAQCHLAARMLVTLDLDDFYGHVTSTQLRLVLYRMGSLVDEDIEFVLRVATKDDVLHQGAPTSPVLANAALFAFDDKLTKLRVTGKSTMGYSRYWLYTRFADDMAFSSQDPIACRHAASLIKRVEHAAASVGQKLAVAKIHYAKESQSQRVQGLIVNGASTKRGVRLPREFHRMLRAALHNRAMNRTIKWTDEQLRSAISLVQMVEPGRGAEYLKSFTETKR